MSRLRLLPSASCPPDKFRFTFPQDGQTVAAFDKHSWFTAIRQHYQWNDYPMPADWKEQAESQLCELLPAGWCEYEDGSKPTHFIDARVSLDDVLRGTRVFVDFVAKGSPIVEQEEAERRGKICAACHFLGSVGGCGTCAGISNVVAQAAGTKTTTADQYLGNKSCLICKCAARAQIWMTGDVLRHGVTEEMNRLWPAHCWKGQLLNANDLQ